jgi:glycine betaine/proline transport system ATP-binding protein
MRQDDRSCAYVLGKDRQFAGVVTEESINRALKVNANQDVSSAFLDGIAPLPGDTPLSEIISRVAAAPCGLPVIGEDKKYLGVITKTSLLETLDQESEHLEVVNG